MTSFNAWSQPWLSVTRTPGGPSEQLSLRDTFVHAHDLAGLGNGLTPLDLDSLYRFLPSVGVLVTRDDDTIDEQDLRFSESRVDAFGDTFGERFELFGERPFLQRWDKTQADIEALRDPKVGLKKMVKPLEQLHPHEPGDSSSQWAIRHDARVTTDLASLTMLLVTAWFQTKNGNGKDPWGGGHLKGSAGTWHVNPFAVHYTDKHSLARTIFANMPAAWLDNSDLPLFLNHENVPADFATAAMNSVTCFTYATTLPLIYVEDGTPTGFVQGADAGIAIPHLAATRKESLGLVHARDHTRLHSIVTKKNAPATLRPRGSFGTRLSSTEGFERWFRAGNGVSVAMQTWRAIPRVLVIEKEAEYADWTISMFSETTDGKGTRSWAAWDEMPAGFAAASGPALSAVQGLLAFADVCRRKFTMAGRTATGDKEVPLAVTGQAAFYTNLMPLLTRLADAVNHGETVDLRTYAEQVTAIARSEFDTMTRPLIATSRVADVAAARSQFRRAVRSELHKLFPMPASNADHQIEEST